MNQKLHFLLVDDDPFNNFLSRVLITHLDCDIQKVDSFSNPEDALEFIENNYTAGEDKHTIILLDINLPRLAGWDFIERLKKKPESISSQFEIHILSSYIEGRDKNRVALNPLIKGFMQKPLEKELLLEALAPAVLQSAG